MSSFNIDEPIHWWCSERSDGLDPHMYYILPWIFTTLESLYIMIPKFSREWQGRVSTKVDGIHTMIINIDLSSEDYAVLRAIISLVGDLYNLIESIKCGNMMELRHPLTELYNAANKFRDIRNFFTHIDDRIKNLDKHGITGARKTTCIEYGTNTKGCFHIIFSGQKIYFSDDGRDKETDFSNSAFEEIFNAARSLHGELIKHKTNANSNYLPPDSLYRL